MLPTLTRRSFHTLLRKQGGVVSAFTREYDSWVKRCDHDVSPNRHQKRTSAADLTRKAEPFVVRIVFKDSVYWSNVQFYDVEVSPAFNTQHDPLLGADLIPDWDEGLSSVVGAKRAEFQFLSFLAEAREMLALSAFSNIIGQFRNAFARFLGIGSSLWLTNSLVVRPTGSDVTNMLTAPSNTYEDAVRRLKELQRPTKFSTGVKKVVVTTSIKDDRYLIFSGSGPGSLHVRINWESITQTRVKGSGIVYCNAQINHLLLSTTLSNYTFDLESVWNLLLLSWVIDYFAPIGKALAVDTVDFASFTAGRGVITRKCGKAVTIKSLEILEGADYYDVFLVGPGYISDSLFLRDVVGDIEFDGADVEVVRPGNQSMNALANIAALLASAIAAFFGSRR